jgi:FKBP-type peptidyl-prolyl cis-trans isomerase FkpA
MRLRHILALILFAALPLACSGTDATSPSGVDALQITDLRLGAGAEATVGRTLVVDYTGWLYDASKTDGKGQQFDTSQQRGPFTFTLGTGQVIAGWDQGLVGMRAGGQRRLVIPPALAYGSSGSGPIPPNATLVFDVDLREVD